jgi:hypothetical protein
MSGLNNLVSCSTTLGVRICTNREHKVVYQDSAVLNLPKETPLPMQADHRGICKFLTANSQRYQAVLSSQQDLVDEDGDKNDEGT